MIEVLKNMLVGREFIEDEYETELNIILDECGMELNSFDFEYDRVYYKNYLFEDNWENNFIGEIEKEYFEKETKENGIEYVTDMIRIIHVFK